MNYMITFMKTKNNISIFLIIYLILFSSCEKSLSEIKGDKERDGYYVVFSDENSFIYSNSKIIGYYNHIKKADSILYKDGETEICLYEPNLKISEDGEISVEKDFSDQAYKGYLNYFDKALMTEEVRKALTKGMKFNDSANKPRFFSEGSFVVTYNTRKFLICPKDGRSVEALLVDDEAGYVISYPDYGEQKFKFELCFTLSDLPIKLQPKFASKILNIALYSDTIESENNPLRWFSYPIVIEADGSIVESDYVYSNDDWFKIQKTTFKDAEKLKIALEQNKDIITEKYNDILFRAVIDKAHTLEYYFDVFCNKNELQRKNGQTCYINGTIKRISEKDEDGDYYISFDFSTLDNFFFFINGYTKDKRIANLHLPAQVILKGTLYYPNGIRTNHLTFNNLELIGIVNK